MFSGSYSHFFRTNPYFFRIQSTLILDPIHSFSGSNPHFSGSNSNLFQIQSTLILDPTHSFSGSNPLFFRIQSTRFYGSNPRVFRIWILCMALSSCELSPHSFLHTLGPSGEVPPMQRTVSLINVLPVDTTTHSFFT